MWFIILIRKRNKNKITTIDIGNIKIKKYNFIKNEITK